MSNKRNILITGASDGIGAALALRLSQAEHRLFLLARNQQKLENISKKCEQLNAEIIIHQADVTKTSELQQLIETIDAEFPIDLVICNAGITNSAGKKGEAESWDEITKVIDTNLYGVLATLNPLIERLQTRKCGHIAIVSSLAAFYGMPITPIYCASKSALKGYGEALRGWLKYDNINVTMIYPGFVKSDLSDQFNTHKPFMISSEKAADIIVKGIENKRASVSFPLSLSLGIRLLNILPSRVADWFMGILFGAKKR